MSPKSKTRRAKAANKRKNPVAVTAPQTLKSKISAFINRNLKIISGIILILSGTVAYFDLKDRFESPKEIHEKENFVEGDLKPSHVKNFTSDTIPKKQDIISKSFSEVPPIFRTTPIVDSYRPLKGLLFKKPPGSTLLYLTIGSVKYPIFYKELESNPPLPLAITNMCGLKCPIYLSLKNDRLYISAEFRDLQKEERIGTIEFNHWRLYVPNLLDWAESETQLQVWDKKGFTVCAVETDGYSTCTINGYYITPTSIWILGNNGNEPDEICFLKTDSNWKQKSEIEIAKIKPLLIK